MEPAMTWYSRARLLIVSALPVAVLLLCLRAQKDAALRASSFGLELTSLQALAGSATHADPLTDGLAILKRRVERKRELQDFLSSVNGELKPAHEFEDRARHISQLASKLRVFDQYHHVSNHEDTTNVQFSGLVQSAVGSSDLLSDINQFEHIYKAEGTKLTTTAAKDSAVSSATKAASPIPIPTTDKRPAERPAAAADQIDDAQVNGLLKIADQYEQLSHKMRLVESKLGINERMLKRQDAVDDMQGADGTDEVAVRLRGNIESSKNRLKQLLRRAADLHQQSLKLKQAHSQMAGLSSARSPQNVGHALGPSSGKHLESKAEANLMKARAGLAKLEGLKTKAIDSAAEPAWRMKYDKLMRSKNEENHFIAREIKSHHTLQDKISHNLEQERSQMAKNLRALE